MIEIIVDSIDTFLKIHKDLNHSREKLIYRGCVDKNYSLTPGLFRKINSPKEHISYKQLDFISREEKAIISFLSSFKHFNKESAFLSYIVAQHYGMPTRLLDFSKSFLIATLFACVDWAYCNNKDNMDGVIYSLSTQNFKRKTKASEYKQLFFHNNENEDFYYLDTRGNESNDVRKRIKKQKGCFIFFNNIRYSVLSDSFIRHKIIIKADLKQKLIKWLKNNKQICLINIT